MHATQQKFSDWNPTDNHSFGNLLDKRITKLFYEALDNPVRIVQPAPILIPNKELEKMKRYVYNIEVIRSAYCNSERYSVVAGTIEDAIQRMRTIYKKENFKSSCVVISVYRGIEVWV